MDEHPVIQRPITQALINEFITWTRVSLMFLTSPEGKSFGRELRQVFRLAEIALQRPSIMSDLPVSVWTGEFTLFGVTLRCHVLDDGRRIIDADDIAKLLSAEPTDPDHADMADLQELLAWCRGAEPHG
jgi:hypothetical protein